MPKLNLETEMGDVLAARKPDNFHEAVDRGKRLKEELERCDSLTRAQLMAAWKELLTENFFDLIKSTNSVLTLIVLDNHIGLGIDNAIRDARKAQRGKSAERPSAG